MTYPQSHPTIPERGYMQLPDLKSLSKIIDVCRKKGVSKITIGDVSLELGPKEPKYSPGMANVTPPSDIANDWQEPTPEELLFWSASPSAEK
jgi:hypothetical protein